VRLKSPRGGSGKAEEVPDEAKEIQVRVEAQERLE
jgi:hypothetical protein